MCDKSITKINYNKRLELNKIKFKKGLKIKMKLDTTTTVDLNEFSDFIHSEKFSQFLLKSTTSFSVAALVLQTLFDAEKEFLGSED